VPILEQHVPIQTFLEQFSDSLCATTANQLTPRFTPAVLEAARQTFQYFGQPLLPAQENIAAALSHAYTYASNAICAAEMSTGKTRIGGAVASLLSSRRTLVLCPPHLVRKWQDELEVLLPGVQASILGSISDIDAFAQLRHQSRWPLFAILSREKAKLSYARRSTLVSRLRILNHERFVQYVCPQCGHQVLDDSGIPITPRSIKTNDRCRTCSSPLWAYDPKGPRRMALADYIGKQHPRLFDFIILDEAQETKARASAQALAFALLLSKSRRGLALTGTLSSGKSTSLFHILWRMNPAIRSSFKISDEARWVDLFGTWETRTTDVDTHTVLLTGKQSKRRVHVTVRERPGISPHLIPYLVGNTAFFQLRDLGKSLPPYREIIGECQMHPALAANYDKLKEAARELIPEGRKRRDGHLVSCTIQALLAYPDRAWQGEEITDNEGVVRFKLDPLPADVLMPKEQALIDLLHTQREAGRRVLVYCTHTRTRDITTHLEHILTTATFRSAILPASVKPEKRMDWINQRTQQGLDVLIANPKAVQTGLDLIDYPTIVWFEPEYSIYVVRQASRRSYRIPQKLPVEVHFLLYKQTMQEHAWALVAAGINASLQTEGDVSAEGINEYQQPDDMMTQLVSQVLDRNASVLSAETMFTKLASTYKRLAPEDEPRVSHTPRTRNEEPYDQPPKPIPLPTVARAGVAPRIEQLTLFAA
jgi:SNF2 family DNA or RNA helicase